MFRNTLRHGRDVLRGWHKNYRSLAVILVAVRSEKEYSLALGA